MWRGDQAALERLLSEGLVMAGVGALLISIAATVFGVSAFVLDHSKSEWPHAASGALELASTSAKSETRELRRTPEAWMWLYIATDHGRSQGVVATTSLIFSNGVIQPSVSRGRPLS
jgi:hypothetical protein